MPAVSPLLKAITSSNATFVAFFAFSAYGLQWFVVKSIDFIWETHNYKVGSSFNH